MENFFRRHKPAASPSAWQNVDTVAPGICRLPTKGLFGSYSYFLSRFHMGSSVTKDLRTSLTVPYCRRCVYFCIVVAGGYAIFNLIADLTTSTPPTSYFDCGPSTYSRKKANTALASVMVIPDCHRRISKDFLHSPHFFVALIIVCGD
ncbi:hypothetical protein LIPSTDRAFT_129441 [Lipomyces starkeyi NRRL Y-11557]|uniref:Uncharacterized protein n=1 Tax=Lipomyces starkeyi NRRL Y-11557 TaxID=675824 RepID=A0A1E3QF25_LIPST|nr:hypothetical protein LIPSTDRAFT_129441 [Lipomyces starkeyi NRRL Y-11557]